MGQGQSEVDDSARKEQKGSTRIQRTILYIFQNKRNPIREKATNRTTQRTSIDNVQPLYAAQYNRVLMEPTLGCALAAATKT